MLSTPAIHRPETVVDACTRALRHQIVSGAWPPGTRLPPERELAEQMGVTRVTLRSALARLGPLLEARQGRGTEVRDFRRFGAPDLLVAVVDSSPEELPAIVADLLVVRRKLAAGVLERLAEQRPDPSDVRAAVNAFAQVIADGGSIDALAKADVDVIAALVATTRSTVFALALNPIASVLAALPALRAAIYREPTENLLGYRALLAWLDNPNPQAIDALDALLAERDRATLEVLHARTPAPP